MSGMVETVVGWMELRRMLELERDNRCPVCGSPARVWSDAMGEYLSCGNCMSEHKKGTLVEGAF